MPTLSSADPVLETQVFWDLHRKKVFALLVLALLAVAAWGAYRFYAERRDTTAANQLTAAKTTAEYQKVIAEYPRTPAAGSAYLLLAEEQRKEKKFDGANVTLQSFVEKYPAHELKGTARLAMAANLESLGKRDEALAAYQRLATDDPQGFSAPFAMISQLHILKEKNQLEEARRLCETILTKYRDSMVANEATRQLRLFKPATPPEVVADKIPAPAPSVNVPSLLARPPDLPTAAPPVAVPPTSASPTVAGSPTAVGSPTAAPSVQGIPRKFSRHRKR